MAIQLTVTENEAVKLQGLETSDDAKLEADPTTVVSENDYEKLRNLPSIENVPLVKNISLNDLGISAVIEADLAAAKASGMFKGDKGDKGETGEQGPKGDTGKTAYQYAVEGGYTGTEAEFASKLATAIPSKTSDITNDSGFITLADLPIYNGGVS